jgi:UDP-glucuronate decarboxylase
MNVFLTGATGFVGSNVARALLATGSRVTALVRPTASLWRLHGVVDDLVLVRGEIADTEVVRRALETCRPDACIHLAWYAEPGKYLRAPENLSALTTSLSLLAELGRAKCPQVVMAGTCAEYDTSAGCLREDGVTRPETLYAATKLSLCLIGQQLASECGFGFAWARLFYLYGPYEDDRRMVPALVQALLRGASFAASQGDQVRDYLHVEDVAAGLCALARSTARGVFNVCSGVPVTVRQLMEVAQEVVGSGSVRFGAVPPRGWEPPFICGSNGRLRELGWEPKYSLKEGLHQVAAWWQARLYHRR